MILAALVPSAMRAQVRTASDIDSKTFVIGLDNYFVGQAGGLGFTTAGKVFRVSLAEGAVTVAQEGSSEGTELYNKGLTIPFANTYMIPVIMGEFVIGVHDFTGDGQPELVIAVKDASVSGVEAYIIQYYSGKWESIGEIAAFGNNISECRIFRQAITIKNPSSGALYSWTCHGRKFDFKASDGTKDPSSLF